MPDSEIPAPDVRSPRGCMVKNARVLLFVHNTEYFAFKVDTIRWVNDRLGDPNLATRDATMGSILVLSCFEVSFSNCERNFYVLQ